MRKILISFCATTFITAGVFFVGCSSDDSTTTPGVDSGTDTGTTDTSTGTDTGTADTGADTGAACQTCGEALQTGPQNLCTTNGPPSSAALAGAFVACICDNDAAANCGTVCADLCSSFAKPTTDCSNCYEAQCGAQLGACAADGTDAGPPPTDAGDGGD